MALKWYRPLLMLGSLLLGVLVALGHHLFYNRLDGQEAPDGDFQLGSLKYSKQQANLLVGNLLAFVSTTALGLAASIAYFQLFWWLSAISKPTSLSELDVRYSALGNIFRMFHFHIWRTQPVSWVLALIVWLSPLATIFTPGTLTIKLTRVSPPATMLQVPYVNFTSLSFAADMPILTDALGIELSQYYYAGPSQATQRISTAVSVQAAILPITAPATNSTWALDFFGPNLQCDPMADQMQQNISKIIADYNFNTSDCYQPLAYLAWTSRDLVLNSSSGSISTSALSPAGQDASLFIVTLPDMWSTISLSSHSEPYACHGSSLGASDSQPLGVLGSNATMLQCQLFNSSYHVAFNYSDGVQRIDIQAENVESQAPISVIDYVYGPNSESGPHCSVLNTNGAVDCFFNATLAQTLAYQSIVEAFNQPITGTIAAQLSEGFEQVSNTSIITTMLTQTPELAFLQDGNSSNAQSNSFGFSSLQEQFSMTNDTIAKGLTNRPSAANSPLSNITLARALEDMFRNTTISLMSSDIFQQSSPLLPFVANVTKDTYTNVYIYAVDKLWLSYGPIIFLSVTAVAVGLGAMVRSQAVFSDNFSTILRATRWASVTPDVMQRDAPGADPLPEYLSKALVAFDSSLRKQEQPGSDMGEEDRSLVVSFLPRPIQTAEAL